MNEVQLPLLDNHIQLDPLQVQEFRSKGHTLVKEVLKPGEVAEYREAINEAAYAYNTEKRALEERDTYGKAFLQIMNLWEVDEKVRRFTLAKRFAKIAA